MLEHGIYCGAYVAGTLVAVAGTHAIARRHRIAAIGNVFTHPTHRGRGLAATTGAVAQALVPDGAREVALNVAANNCSRPATRAARLREWLARSGRQ
jgi:predicted GNAT family acetyltransferase